MRKYAALVLLCTLCAAPLEVLFGQARPRRVGQTQQQAPSTTTATPNARTAPTPLPSATTTRTKAGRTGTQARLPQEVAEEIGEDEVVRVNTALVTIPVSILDRDGRFIPTCARGLP